MERNSEAVIAPATTKKRRNKKPAQFHRIRNKPAKKPPPARKPTRKLSRAAKHRKRFLDTIRSDVSIIDLRQNAASRPLDWRWQQAAYLARTGKPVSRFQKNRFIIDTRRFISALHRCQSDGDLEQLQKAAPAVFTALDIYCGAGKNFRWELESRILACESYQSIAGKMGVAEETVESYEALFFNVRDRLESPGWITHHVIGSKIHSGLTEEDVDVLWKFYGYFGGPFVLDELITDFADEPKPNSAGEVQDFFDRDVRNTLMRRAAIAIRVLSLVDPNRVW